MSRIPLRNIRIGEITENMTKKKALVIGIDNYPQYPLQGCIGDARRISIILKSGSCNFDTLTILDSEATRSTVREYIHWLLSDAEVSLLYFAGHGWRSPVGTYLVTHDTEPFDEGIELQWLASAANRIANGDQTVLFIFDCCHSGDANPRDASQVPRSVEPADIPAIPGKGRVVVAACAGNQKASETKVDGEIHGVFTHHLCMALSGAASDQDGTVTVNAAYDYVVSMLKESPNQTPVLKGDQQGSIELARYVAKVGTWSPSNSTKLTAAEASQQGEQLLSTIHQVIAQDDSFEGWKREGFANACRSFLPTLTWFRRRVDAQPELLSDAQFKAHYDSCNHFLTKLCSVGQGTNLLEGHIASKVGSGTFGTVWKVEGTQWRQPVCLKAFHPHDLHDKEKVGRFRRGYYAMHQLDHPNIVKVLQLGEVPFGFYMDYIDGANLRNFNPAATAEPDQVADILIGIVETLKHAHGRGVIHRDVKPENILIDFSKEPKEPFLTDFDLAWFSSATQVTQVAGFGSHYYAAPEQMDSPSASVTHLPTVDIYSFGQLCFFAVCGRDPLAFNHDGNVRAFAAELGRKWRDSDASKELLDIFDRCTRFKPKERIQDFREISDRLARVRAFLNKSDGLYDNRKFLAQLCFNLSGDLPPAPSQSNSSAISSRSSRTQMTLALTTDNREKCGVEVIFRPNEIIREGRTSSQARLVVNQRIDSMLQAYARDHSTERKGAKGGAYEITVRMMNLPKTMEGVLKCREIVTRTLDILEQA